MHVSIQLTHQPHVLVEIHKLVEVVARILFLLRVLSLTRLEIPIRFEARSKIGLDRVNCIQGMCGR